jgi:hypothetical protein
MQEQMCKNSLLKLKKKDISGLAFTIKKLQIKLKVALSTVNQTKPIEIADFSLFYNSTLSS